MKRTAYFMGLAFLISIVSFLGFVGSVKAVPAYDEDDVWSEPNGYAHAYVLGTYNLIGAPPPVYYRVYHEADIFECIRGRTRFYGYSQSGNLLYSVYRYFSGTMHEEYDPPYVNQIQLAHTETWAPYYFPPSPYMEHAHASIGPPGWL